MLRCTLVIFLICARSVLYAQDCKSIPTHFSSYEQAVKTVKASSFKLTDAVNTSKSSWIRAASYYSCDGKTGYFIMKTDGGEYIHKDMPIDVWRGFKNAPSFGTYYNQNIKNRYHFYLN